MSNAAQSSVAQPPATNFSGFADSVEERVLNTEFSPVQVDCTTAVVLKILDCKCKMSIEEQSVLMLIYDLLNHQASELFDEQVHTVIHEARKPDEAETFKQTIHELRLLAEARIPKPVMKDFKRFLRENLFKE